MYSLATHQRGKGDAPKSKASSLVVEKCAEPLGEAVYPTPKPVKKRVSKCYFDGGDRLYGETGTGFVPGPL